MGYQQNAIRKRKKKMCKMRLQGTGLNLNHVDDVDFLAITFNEMGFKKYFKLFTSIYQ